MILGSLQMLFYITVIYTLLVGWILKNKGKDVAQMNHPTRFNHRYRKAIIRQHKDLATMFFIGVVFLLIIAEITVRISAPTKREWLFYLHLTFAIPGFLGLLAIYFKYNGVKHQKIHSSLSHIVLDLMFGALVTGVPLVMNIFQQ
jgi:ABC-type Fe3+ transport system permease subunit